MFKYKYCTNNINTKLIFCFLTVVILSLLVTTADNLCKQFWPIPGPTTRYGSNLFDTLKVFPKDVFEKVGFEKNQQTTKKTCKKSQHAGMIQRYRINKKTKANMFNNWAATCDFQQYGIFTWIDSDKPVHLPFKLRNSKWCSVSSLTVIEYSSD